MLFQYPETFVHHQNTNYILDEIGELPHLSLHRQQLALSPYIQNIQKNILKTVFLNMHNILTLMRFLFYVHKKGFL